MMKQYGAIPFLREDGHLRVVLVNSANGYWIFPKGRYEEKLGKRGTAEAEAFEEAGAKGKIHKDMAYRAKVLIRSGERVHLTLYALEVKKLADSWPEEGRRTRRILTIEEAEEAISSDELRSCLQKFARDFLD